MVSQLWEEARGRAAAHRAILARAMIITPGKTGQNCIDRMLVGRCVTVIKRPNE